VPSVGRRVVPVFDSGRTQIDDDRRSTVILGKPDARVVDGRTKTPPRELSAPPVAPARWWA
jgi:hypothetical protein